MAVKSFLKDPNATLDWVFNWVNWLTVGETISSYTITVAPGLTKSTSSNTATTITVWLSGGTAGNEYSVACKIVTSDSRTDERTINIAVSER